MNNNHDLTEGLIREVFDEYITNEMPIRLLYITKDQGGMKFRLVDRTFVNEHFESVPNEIYEKFHGTVLVDREESIRVEVKERLKYAILSHRWLPKGSEPLYHNMLKEPIEVLADLKGWEKLQEFCRKAIDDHGCKLAWADTCCIDNSSSAELDESIRSMFRWYRNSHIYIAFLSETADLGALQSQAYERGAKVDPWFSRGWTLQELLAPTQIKFYGKSWQPLVSLRMFNDRFSRHIMHLIFKITHIPEKDLESFSPGTNRVPEKMLWASQRQTTRIEDRAYCLIGIFDVSLMSAYGEGNRAFFRLMEEILKRYDKWDVFLWSGRCSRYNAALPEAPCCYPIGYSETHVTRREDAVNEEQWINAQRDVGDGLFTLTNHGLRIKVFLQEVELAHTEDITDNSRHLWFGNVAWCMVPVVKHIGAKRKDDTRWAIGILDYWVQPMGMKGFVDSSRQEPFTGFLLSYDKHAPDARWRKEMTEEIVKIESSSYEVRPLTQLYL